MGDRRRFDRCKCAYCTYPEDISTPDAGGEYPGIDEHMQRLEDALDECQAGDDP